jgi:ABC-type Fe3+-hydroxamate transport system substrate-binding protein
MSRRVDVSSLAVIGATIILLGVGCGERSEPRGASVDVYPVTVEQAPRAPIVLDRQPTSIDPLTPEAASLVSSVVGRPVSAQPRAGTAELVVTTPESQASSGAKGPTYVAGDASMREVERSLSDLGLLLDRPIRARQLVDDIEAKRTAVRRHLEGISPVSVFVDTGLFSTVTRQTLLGDMIAEAGGTNIAGSGSQEGPFDVRRLAKLNPDYYLATSDSGTTLAGLRHDKRTRHLKAVQQRHFLVLSAKAIEPGARTGTALIAIARYLHRHAFR